MKLIDPHIFKILERNGEYVVERSRMRVETVEQAREIKLFGRIPVGKKITGQYRLSLDEFEPWFGWDGDDESGWELVDKGYFQPWHPSEDSSVLCFTWTLDDESRTTDRAIFSSREDAVNTIRYFYGHRAVIEDGEWRVV